MTDQNKLLLLIGGASLIVLILLLLCGKDYSEHYKRSCLQNDCNLQRSPVDYAFKDPRTNPHYQTSPGNDAHPLAQGPIDFHMDLRRLNQTDGVLFQEFDQNYKGCGLGEQYIVNDEKGRFDLTNVGDVGTRNQLDDVHHERHGPRGFIHTERRYDEPNGCFDMLYGGSDFFVNDRLGD